MSERRDILHRAPFIFGLVFLLPCAIILQLVRINLWDGHQLRELWSAQAIDFVPIPAQRGDILDDQGRVLATNTISYNLAVDPGAPKMDRNKLNRICDSLAAYTGLSYHQCRRKIADAPRGSRYIVMAKGLNTRAWQSLHSLNYRGIILSQQYKRRYNYDSLAAPVLGYVNYNMDGVNGLEKYYNDMLRGENGLQQVQLDNHRHIRAVLGTPRKNPVNGYNLHTTLDVHIQAVVQEELENGVERTHASYGEAIVLDPKTGAVKAMANYPSFNPNAPGQTPDEVRRNMSVTDMIEPGSTFKLVMAIAAMQQGVVTLKDTIRTPPDGKKLIYGQWMKDHEPLGTMTFPQIVQKSSDIGSAEIAMRLKPQVFYQYARNLGFGSPTQIDLPYEESGRLRKPYTWSKISLPWMAIGYGVQVTPIQLAQAYAALANGGVVMRPHLVDYITDDEGDVVKRFKAIKVRRVASASTIKKLIPVFEGVVSDSGTAALAKVQGLEIAGKTGTAQIYQDGKYHYEYHATFVGFFPANDPKYVCLIIMDKPRTTIYGGLAAAPVFHNIAKRVARMDPDMMVQPNDDQYNYLAVAPDLSGMRISGAKEVLGKLGIGYNIKGDGKVIDGQKPDAGTQLKPGQRIELATEKIEPVGQNQKYVTVPDLHGMSMRQAMWYANERGLNLKMIGSGTIYTQFPLGGQRMQVGATVTVRGKAQSIEDLTKSGGTGR